MQLQISALPRGGTGARSTGMISGGRTSGDLSYGSSRALIECGSHSALRLFIRAVDGAMSFYKYDSPAMLLMKTNKYYGELSL